MGDCTRPAYCGAAQGPHLPRTHRRHLKAKYSPPEVARALEAQKSKAKLEGVEETDPGLPTGEPPIFEVTPNLLKEAQAAEMIGWETAEAYLDYRRDGTLPPASAKTGEAPGPEVRLAEGLDVKSAHEMTPAEFSLTSEGTALVDSQFNIDFNRPIKDVRKELSTFSVKELDSLLESMDIVTPGNKTTKIAKAIDIAKVQATLKDVTRESLAASSSQKELNSLLKKADIFSKDLKTKEEKAEALIEWRDEAQFLGRRARSDVRHRELVLRAEKAGEVIPDHVREATFPPENVTPEVQAIRQVTEGVARDREMFGGRLDTTSSVP